MPTEKPLPDDIIDLTDLVEEERPGGTPAGEDAPVDMSFERELEDLFGDVDPAPAKKAPAPKAAAAADDADLIDLAGMELVDEAPAPAPAKTPADDDIIDLTDQALDEALMAAPEPEAAPAPAPTAAPADDLADLTDAFPDLAEPEPEPVPAPAATTTPVDDLADLTDAFPDLAEPEPEPVPAPAATAAPADDLAEMANVVPETAPEVEAPAPKAASPAEEPISLEDLAVEDLTPAPEGLASQADMDALLGDLPETEFPAAEAAPARDDAVNVAELADLPALDEPPAAPTPPPAPADAAKAGPIDLDALDRLITTAKGPVEPEPEAQPDADALAGLTARLDALEQATASVAENLQALLALPDADTLAARLEQTIESRLDGLRAELAPAPVTQPQPTADALDQLRAELLAAIGAATPDPTARIEELRAALAPDFDALRQDLPRAEQYVSKADLAEAMAATKAELLAAIETGKSDPGTLLDDFSGLLETRLADLRRELPGPEAFVTPQGLQQALRELRESLSHDLSAVLETAKQAARDEAKAMGDALTERLDALETSQPDADALVEQVRQAVLPAIPDLDAALESARQNARDDAKAMDDALAQRLDTLEAEHVDADTITEQVRQALMAAIPDVPSALTGLRESISRDLTAALETANRTSKETAEAMGQTLTERIVSLEEFDRIDRQALESLVKTEDFQAALAALRAEIADDIIRRVPQAAAAVIREEIAALAKELE